MFQLIIRKFVGYGFLKAHGLVSYNCKLTLDIDLTDVQLALRSNCAD